MSERREGGFNLPNDVVCARCPKVGPWVAWVGRDRVCSTCFGRAIGWSRYQCAARGCDGCLVCEEYTQCNPKRAEAPDYGDLVDELVGYFEDVLSEFAPTTGYQRNLVDVSARQIQAVKGHACAGMADPAKEIEAMREKIRQPRKPAVDPLPLKDTNQ